MLPVDVALSFSDDNAVHCVFLYFRFCGWRRVSISWAIHIDNFQRTRQRALRCLTLLLYTLVTGAKSVISNYVVCDLWRLIRVTITLPLPSVAQSQTSTCSSFRHSSSTASSRAAPSAPMSTWISGEFRYFFYTVRNYDQVPRSDKFTQQMCGLLF